MQSAASDILGYLYTGLSSASFTLKKCTIFSSILIFVHFKLVLEYCSISGVYLEPYQTSMMRTRSIIDIWQGSKYGYLNKYMDILFLFWKCVTTSAYMTQIKNIIRYFIFPKPFALYYIDHGNTKFSYI